MPKFTTTHKDSISANTIESDWLTTNWTEPKPNRSQKHRTNRLGFTTYAIKLFLYIYIPFIVYL